MPFEARTLDSRLGPQRQGFRVIDTDAARGTVPMNDSSCSMAEPPKNQPPNVKLMVNGMPVEDGGTATVSDTNAMVAPFDAPASGADSAVEKNLSGLIGGKER
jgi:hypothetical protein